MNLDLFFIGISFILAGTFIREISKRDYPQSIIIFDKEHLSAPYNIPLLKPFRLQNKSKIKININWISQGYETYITDYFPGAVAETSGKRYFESSSFRPKDKGIIEVLQKGDYVLCVAPLSNGYFTLESIEFVKKNENIELLGVMLAEIGIAFLTAGLTL